MVSSFTQNLGLENPAIGDQVNSWGTTENTARTILDNANAGNVAVSVAGNSNVALTFTQGSSAQQLPNKKIILTGALTGSINVVWPNARGGHYIVQNSTSGAFSITLGNNNGSGAPAGRSVVIPQGRTIQIFSDGTNVDYSDDTMGALQLATPLPVASGGTGASTLAGASIVTGPASAMAGNIASFADTTGKVIQDSGAAANALVPSGALMPYAGSAAPSGWQLCNGSAISRATFAVLFAVIGTTYGAGDGSTTFNLPDLRGRVPAGFDSGNATGRLTANTAQGVSASALGNAGGEQAHAQTSGELATHGHPVNITDPGHGHGGITPTGSWSGTFGTQYIVSSVNNNVGGTAGGAVAASTGISATTSNAGSGSAANVVQPTLVLNYIIKT